MQCFKSINMLKLNQNGFRHLLPTGIRLLNLPVHEKYKELNNTLQKIITDVIREKKCLDMIPNIEQRIQEATTCNASGEYNITSNILFYAYNIIEKPEKITAESVRQASLLTWAIQMTDSYSRIMKDVEKTLENNVRSVKDANLLRSFIYAMIEQKFRDTKAYHNVLQLFNKAFLYDTIDLNLARYCRKQHQHNNYDNFTSEQYQFFCDYHISYPRFQLPMFLALALANKDDNNMLEIVTEICSKVGLMYQIQNDFENCFGSEALIGTEGTDIQEGKCTWLAVTALQRFTTPQRVVFEACYGSEEPAHVERVKVLYKQLQLPQLYREKEGALYENIMEQAETVEKYGIPCHLFAGLLDAIRKQ